MTRKKGADSFRLTKGLKWSFTLALTLIYQLKKQNELRYRMEIASWKQRWREAEEECDFIRMAWLNMEYERIELP